MFMIVMHKFLNFPVCGLSDLTCSLFHFFQLLWVFFLIIIACLSLSVIHPSLPSDIIYLVSVSQFCWMVVIWSFSPCLSPFDVILSLSSHLPLWAICVHKCTVYNMSTLSCSIDTVFMKMSSNHPVPFLICSQRNCSVVIGVLHMYLVFCVINLPIFIILTM